MTQRTLFTLLLFTRTLAMVSADESKVRDAEVKHLLEFVDSSNATFIRNGKSHTPAEAAKHLKKKYSRFKKKAKSAEDFIKYAATKSSISGKPYQIKTADGTTVLSAEWLLKELERYRESNVFELVHKS